MNVTPSSLTRWAQAYEKGGMRALEGKVHTGPKPKLTERQRKKLVRLLDGGPKRCGYDCEYWTLATIAEVIEEELLVSYNVSGVWRLVERLGWGG